MSLFARKTGCFRGQFAQVCFISIVILRGCVTSIVTKQPENKQKQDRNFQSCFTLGPECRLCHFELSRYICWYWLFQKRQYRKLKNTIRSLAVIRAGAANVATFIYSHIQQQIKRYLSTFRLKNPIQFTNKGFKLAGFSSVFFDVICKFRSRKTKKQMFYKPQESFFL